MKLLLRLFGLLVLLTLLRPGEACAQGVAFSCDGTFYQIKQPSGESTSFLYKVDRSTAAYSTQPLDINLLNGISTNNLGVLLNGLAYNPQDGYLYALTTSGLGGYNSEGSLYLYKIGQGTDAQGNKVPGIVQVSASPVTVSGTNLGITVSTGTFDKAGNYYFTAQNTGGTSDYNLYKLPVANVTASAVAATVLPLSQTTTMYDMALNPLDGQLYGSNWSGSLYKINPATGTVTTIADSPNANQAAASVGTMFFDVAGNLFAYSNGTLTTNPATPGNFYQ